MSTSINFRVFRRNAKKLVLIWNGLGIPDNSRGSVSVFLVDGSIEGPLTWSKFVPDNPEKFSKDVDGLVIPHSQNKIDPTKPCIVKVLFGEGDDSFEIVKEVHPASASPVTPSVPVDASNSATSGARAMLMYGMDYRTGKWIPFPVHLDGDE